MAKKKSKKTKRPSSTVRTINRVIDQGVERRGASKRQVKDFRK